MSKLWGGRFTKTAEQWVDEFGASIGFDQQLVEEDITGSIAHVTMLAKQHILSEEEAAQIKNGLKTLQKSSSRRACLFCCSRGYPFKFRKAAH